MQAPRQQLQHPDTAQAIVYCQPVLFTASSRLYSLKHVDTVCWMFRTNPLLTPLLCTSMHEWNTYNTACNFNNFNLGLNSTCMCRHSKTTWQTLEPAVITLVTRGVVQLEFNVDYMEWETWHPHAPFDVSWGIMCLAVPIPMHIPIRMPLYVLIVPTVWPPFT